MEGKRTLESPWPLALDMYCSAFHIYILLAVCSWISYLNLRCLSCLVSRSEITLNFSGCSALTRRDRIWKALAQLCAGQALDRWPLCTLAHCWYHLPSSHWQPINHLIWGVTQFEALVAKFRKIIQRCIIITVNKLSFLNQYFYISFKNSI